MFCQMTVLTDSVGFVFIRPWILQQVLVTQISDNLFTCVATDCGKLRLRPVSKLLLYIHRMTAFGTYTVVHFPVINILQKYRNIKAFMPRVIFGKIIVRAVGPWSSLKSKWQ